MSTFYVSCIVNNTKDSECYDFILEYKSGSSAKKAGKKEAIKQFNDDHEEPATSVIIDEFYKTSFDARL